MCFQHRAVITFLQPRIDTDTYVEPFNSLFASVAAFGSEGGFLNSRPSVVVRQGAGLISAQRKTHAEEEQQRFRQCYLP